MSAELVGTATIIIVVFVGLISFVMIMVAVIIFVTCQKRQRKLGKNVTSTL